MSIKNVMEDIKKGNLKKVYLFYGEEEFLMDYSLKVIKDKYIDSGLESLNYIVFEGKDTPLDSIYNACETLPFMSQKRIVVGMNKFQVEEEHHKDILRVDPEVELLQREKLKDLKKTRNNEEVENRLKALKTAAGTDENLMPYILEAVKVYATLGEICGVLREVFGEYEQSVIL